VGTAVDLFWLARLGWEYLDKQREQAELVYGYPDSSILTVNWALLTGYSSAVEDACGRDLLVYEDLRHPSNLHIYRWFDNDLDREPQSPELALDYTAALNKLFLVTFALAKLEREIGEESSIATRVPGTSAAVSMDVFHVGLAERQVAKASRGCCGTVIGR